jgi:hypothetical protein
MFIAQCATAFHFSLIPVLRYRHKKSTLKKRGCFNSTKRETKSYIYFMLFFYQKAMPTAFHFSFFCVSRLEGRSVRSTERSEARKVATP